QRTPAAAHKSDRSTASRIDALRVTAPSERVSRRSSGETFFRAICLMGQKPLASLERGCKYATFRLEHLLVGEDAMSDDALFQLGMDLDHGSSTAQTEEKQSQCHPSQEDERKDFFCERDGVRYAGTHLIIDLVRAVRLDDLEHIEATLRRCVEVAGATLVHIHLHHFTPNGGVSGVAVLAESHTSIHSCPQHGFPPLDT